MAQADQVAIQGNGNLTVSTGSGSIINITTCCHNIPEEDHSTDRQEFGIRCTCQKPKNSKQLCLQHERESKALVPVVPKPVGRPQRLHKCNTFMIIDNLNPLSAEGKAPKCSGIIAKLQKVKTDPDSQVSLLLAASFNAIYEGPDFEKANRLLHGAKAIIPETQHEAEHRVWLRHVQSVAKLRAGNYKMGIILAEDTLSLLDTVAPGGMTAWVLLNYAWFLTEIAAGEDDDEDRQYLMKKAERAYWHAIEHAENEDSMQMLHTQSRVPMFAKIGLALLYLGGRISVDNFRFGISHVSLDDIKKGKNVITALEKEGTIPNSVNCRLMMAKTYLHYRRCSYQQAYDLAQETKVFATEHSLGRYAKFADSIVQYLQDHV